MEVPIVAKLHGKCREMQAHTPIHRYTFIHRIFLCVGITIALFASSIPCFSQDAKTGGIPSLDSLIRKGKIYKESLGFPGGEERVFSSTPELIDSLLPGFVTLYCYNKGKLIGTASGFFWDRGGGSNSIITNHHVVSFNGGGEEESIPDSIVAKKYNGLLAPVERVLYVDEIHDLAILSVSPANRTKKGFLVKRFVPRQGDDIILFSSPSTERYLLEQTVSKGIISSLRNERGSPINSYNARNFAEEVDRIQITASSGHGGSGGPVVDTNGVVVGILAGGIDPQIAPDLSIDYVQNVVFAIPTKYLFAMRKTPAVNKTVAWYNAERLAKLGGVSRTSRITRLWYEIQYLLNLANCDLLIEKCAELAHLAKGSVYEAEAWKIIGICYVYQGKYSEAEAVLRKALAINQNDAQLQYLLGTVCDALNKKQEAISHLEKAVELDNELQTAYDLLCKIYAELNLSPKSGIVCPNTPQTGGSQENYPAQEQNGSPENSTATPPIRTGRNQNNTSENSTAPPKKITSRNRESDTEEIASGKGSNPAGNPEMLPSGTPPAKTSTNPKNNSYNERKSGASAAETNPRTETESTIVREFEPESTPQIIARKEGRSTRNKSPDNLAQKPDNDEHNQSNTTPTATNEDADETLRNETESPQSPSGKSGTDERVKKSVPQAQTRPCDTRGMPSGTNPNAYYQRGLLLYLRGCKEEARSQYYELCKIDRYWACMLYFTVLKSDDSVLKLHPHPCDEALQNFQCDNPESHILDTSIAK